MLGIGVGTFEPVVTYSTGGFGSSEVTIADVNGDGNPDLVVANGCSPTKDCTTYDQSHGVGVLLGRGDGTFHSVVGYASGGFRANSITAIDLNGDGKLDLVVGNQCVPAGCGSSPHTTVGVLLGNGDGTFQAPASYETGAWSGSAGSSDRRGCKRGWQARLDHERLLQREFHGLWERARRSVHIAGEW